MSTGREHSDGLFERRQVAEGSAMATPIVLGKGETGMFRTPLQDVDFQQVETFCCVWPEGVRVEYKQKITQIPKIVSSFANTMGGIWLIGVKTDR